MEPLTSLNSLNPVNPVGPARRPVDDRESAARHATGKERAVELTPDRTEPAENAVGQRAASEHESRQLEPLGAGLDERARAERQRIESEATGGTIDGMVNPRHVSMQYTVYAELDVIQTRVVEDGSDEPVRVTPTDDQIEAAISVHEHIGKNLDLLA